MLACFYLAKKQKWLLCGLAGICLTATKPFGIVIILPMLYEYFKNLKNRKKDTQSQHNKKWAKDILDFYKILPGAQKTIAPSFAKATEGKCSTLEQKIIDHLKREPMDADSIARSLVIPAAKIGTTLS